MREDRTELKKMDVINAVLSYLMRKEFTSISAQKPNFKEPPLIKSKISNEGIRPDMAANLSGKTHLFEIETEVNNYNKERTIQKWEQLSSYAHQKGGELHLIVLDKDQHKAFETIKENDIEADILQVRFK